MLFRRTSPYAGLNNRHPMIAYTVRHVRGGRSPQGTVRFAWVALGIMLAVALVPLLLFLWLYTPSYRGDYYALEVTFYYTLVAGGVSLFAFPIVDFFTVFYAVNSIRAETHNSTKFDLMRTSTIDAVAFVDARLGLARVQAWRVLVYMWAGRLIAVGMMAGVGVTGLGVLLYEDTLNLADMDANAWYFVCFFALCALIFLVQYLGEPLWRLNMLSAYAASVAVRYHANATTWTVLGLGVIVMLGFIGALGAGVVFGSVGLYGLGEWVLDEPNNFAWRFREQWSLSLAVVPYALMPLAVWGAQRVFCQWRRRVTIRYIFQQQGADA